MTTCIIIFRFFDFERTRWRLLQKRVVRTNFFKVPVPTQENKQSRIKDIYISSFYDFSIEFWNCSDSMLLLCYYVILCFKTKRTVFVDYDFMTGTMEGEVYFFKVKVIHSCWEIVLFLGFTECDGLFLW
jgi:hypothetical protein